MLVFAALLIPHVAAGEEQSFAQLAAQSWDTVTSTALSMIQIESEAEIGLSSGTSSSLYVSSLDGADSSWMSIIDLVKSSQLQLDPLPKLQEEFTKATDAFFTELEAQESKSTEYKEAADTLRSTIKSYQSACETIAGSFIQKMDERKEQTK